MITSLDGAIGKKKGMKRGLGWMKRWYYGIPVAGALYIPYHYSMRDRGSNYRIQKLKQHTVLTKVSEKVFSNGIDVLLKDLDHLVTLLEDEDEVEGFVLGGGMGVLIKMLQSYPQQVDIYDRVVQCLEKVIDHPSSDATIWMNLPLSCLLYTHDPHLGGLALLTKMVKLLPVSRQLVDEGLVDYIDQIRHLPQATLPMNGVWIGTIYYQLIHHFPDMDMELFIPLLEVANHQVSRIVLDRYASERIVEMARRDMQRFLPYLPTLLSQQIPRWMQSDEEEVVEHTMIFLKLLLQNGMIDEDMMVSTVFPLCTAQLHHENAEIRFLVRDLLYHIQGVGKTNTVQLNSTDLPAAFTAIPKRRAIPSRHSHPSIPKCTENNRAALGEDEAVAVCGRGSGASGNGSVQGSSRDLKGAPLQAESEQ